MKLLAVHSVQIADETYVAADPARIGAAVGDPANWRRWWPDLLLEVTEERGSQGVRWKVAGPLTGTMEIWLEPMLGGALLHYFLHAEPAGAAAWQLARMNLFALMSDVGWTLRGAIQARISAVDFDFAGYYTGRWERALEVLRSDRPTRWMAEAGRG